MVHEELEEIILRQPKYLIKGQQITKVSFSLDENFDVSYYDK